MALKSTAVLGAAWFAAVLLRKRPASIRHLVWTASLGAVLALPLFSLLLPSLRVPLAPALVAPQLSLRPAPRYPRRPRPGIPGRAPGSAPARRPLPDWRYAALLLWTAGAAVSFVQMLVACVAIRRVRRAANRVSGPELSALAGALGIGRPVEVLETRRGSMPMAFGLRRPAVFLPSDAAEWSDERRRMVLLHELAHVRRGDIATHLLARTALCFYWWNPLAWIAWRAFLKERERAADDLVLDAGARASAYAGHLLEIARALQAPPAIGWAAVAMARRSQLEGRLLAILDSGVARKSLGWRSALAAVAAAVFASLRLLPCAPRRPSRRFHRM